MKNYRKNVYFKIMKSYSRNTKILKTFQHKTF